MKYQKLVRDKIPLIIEADNKQPVTRELDSEEYKLELYKKLREEVEEFIKDENTDELADILEVIYAIGELKQISKEDMENIRMDKATERGVFRDKIFLIEVV